MLYAALALLPALLLMFWLYTRDALHPEPKKAVYRIFLLGAAIVLPAGLLERALFDNGIGSSNTPWMTLFVTAFFVAGMVEEFLKAAIVERAAIEKGLPRNPMDCVVYSGAAALGFAAVENLLYVTSSGFSAAILRSVTAVPAHLMFGIIMGLAFARSIWYGKSRFAAYLVPAAAHGTYDLFALWNSWTGDILLILFLIALLEWTLRGLDWAASRSRPIPKTV